MQHEPENPLQTSLSAQNDRNICPKRNNRAHRYFLPSSALQRVRINCDDCLKKSFPICPLLFAILAEIHVATRLGWSRANRQSHVVSGSPSNETLHIVHHINLSSFRLQLSQWTGHVEQFFQWRSCSLERIGGGQHSNRRHGISLRGWIC